MHRVHPKSWTCRCNFLLYCIVSYIGEMPTVYFQLNMRPPLLTVREEKSIEKKTWMFTQLSICLYGGLHSPIFERGNGFLFGNKLEAKESSRALITASSVSRFYLGGTTAGTGRGGNLMGNMGDAVRPGSQGHRGFPWSPSQCIESARQIIHGRLWM